MSERSKRFLVFIPTLLLVIVLVSAFFVYHQMTLGANAEVAYWEYLDDVSKVNVKDVNGNIHNLEPDKNKIVMFLSANCNSCITSLPLFEKAKQIVCNGQDVELILLWENVIPVKEVQKYHLEENSYSTQNVRVASGYGCSFFVDKNNVVQFYDNGGLANVLTFVKNTVTLDADLMEQNASAYLLSKYGVSNESNLIYFSMPGCPDCAAATKLLEENDIAKYYHVTRIELERGSKIGDMIDECEIFRTAFSIDWYPSFAIIQPDESYQMIRKVEPEELLAALLP